MENMSFVICDTNKRGDRYKETKPYAKYKLYT